MTIAMILSSLALLAATANIGLTLWERKRNQKRNTALMRYVDNKIKENRNDFSGRIAALENGTVPDFEKAKEAANAVNDFNAGIAGILGFDPYAVLQAQREKDHGGE